MNIYEKLIKIQNELNCPKSEFNNFGKYNYRSLEDILNNVKPLLLKYNTTIIINNYLEEFGGIIFRKSELSLFDCESNEKIMVHTYTQESLSKKGMSVEQCSGSTSSYGDKYCLGKLFLIDDTKDPDSTNKHENNKNIQNNNQNKSYQNNNQNTLSQNDIISDAQNKRLFAIVSSSKLGWKIELLREQIKMLWGIDSTKQIKNSHYKWLCDNIIKLTPQDFAKTLAEARKK